MNGYAIVITWEQTIGGDYTEGGGGSRGVHSYANKSVLWEKINFKKRNKSRYTKFCISYTHSTEILKSWTSKNILTLSM